uniref:NACHT domain-containing protein n=1 Tax=Periophthalmus magnuspinnatus TaxID=409849 RepID=A0A3B4BAW7_9GOBI
SSINNSPNIPNKKKHNTVMHFCNNEQVDSSRHEYFDLASRRARIYVHQACQRIQPCHLLTPREGSTRPPKRVKVKGIAGIGKSVAVQRLLYEWAIGKNMREFDCIFDLRFRELNLINEPVSLLELLSDRFRYLKEVLKDLFMSPNSLLFILDGLDEFKFPLKWNSPAKDIGMESKIPLSELMVALIKGNLLPESSVILTTRPSTEAPKQFFQRCCIVLGFEEEQVKKYTYKFYKNIEVADKVYDYILSNDNLFVLSFIPLYCYIICTAMAEFFCLEKQDGVALRSLELNPPKTVSEVYFCYLFTAVKHHALKGSTDRDTSRAQVLSLAKLQLTNLGKLAYENLLQKKIMFDKNDLEKFGVRPVDIQSTFLCHILQLLKEETVDMYSFFHLTVQEHLAALYCVMNLSTEDDILQALDFWCFGKPPSSTTPPLCNIEVHMDKLESLQMFTRFFMGMLRARLAGHLVGLVSGPVEEANGIPAKLGEWYRDQFKGRKLKNLEALNLLHCLMEFHMEDTTSIAAPEIKKLNLFKMKLSVVDCAAMHYVLQFSPHKLQELNLGYSNIGNRGLSRLGPILHRCESLYVFNCNSQTGTVGDILSDLFFLFSLSFSLRYNCLDRQAAILESSILRSNECQVKKLL